MSILSASILLFLIFDPLGNIPLFLAMLKKVEPHRRRIIIMRELIIALIILIVFLFSGQYLLSILCISQSSLGIASGIILFIIALKMIFSSSEEIFTHIPDGEPFVVPLAIPLIAGPSAVAAVILLMASDPLRWFDWLISLIISMLITGAIFFVSEKIVEIFGERLLAAAERLMGMILTTIAVEMFITGIKQSFFAGSL